MPVPKRGEGRDGEGELKIGDGFGSHTLKVMEVVGIASTERGFWKKIDGSANCSLSATVRFRTRKKLSDSDLDSIYAARRMVTHRVNDMRALGRRGPDDEEP